MHAVRGRGALVERGAVRARERSGAGVVLGLLGQGLAELWPPVASLCLEDALGALLVLVVLGADPLGAGVEVVRAGRADHLAGVPGRLDVPRLPAGLHVHTHLLLQVLKSAEREVT